MLSDHKASSQQLHKQLSQQTEDSNNDSGNGATGSRFTPQLRPFTDIAGYSGVSADCQHGQKLEFQSQVHDDYAPPLFVYSHYALLTCMYMYMYM